MPVGLRQSPCSLRASGSFWARRAHRLAFLELAAFRRYENQRTGAVLAERARVARGLIQTVLGLHLLPDLRQGEGLLLPGATVIDTAFMHYAIDLVFVDRSHRVTRVVSNLKPWRMVWGAHGGRDCLELPAGAIEATNTRPGDQLLPTTL